MADLVIPYTPQPRQLRAHLADASEVFYGGAAGGGKSAMARWDLVDFCLHCPKLFAVLFRQSAPQLKANHIEFLHRELPPGVATWNETHKEFRFGNGSLLCFRHLSDKQALEDIQGWEIHIAALDEAALLDPHAIAFVKSRLRLGNYRKFLEGEAKKNPRLNEYLRRLPRLLLTSNPGGPSHQYLKDNYISPALPETLFYDEDGKKSRIFIPAKMSDNSYLDDNYAAQFKDLPAHQQRQLVDGDWNVVPGAYFDCFSSEKHVVEPFPVPAHWTRFRSCDWGYATPFSIGWWAVADGTPVVAKDGSEYTFPEGAMIRYREWYGAKEGKRGPINEGLKLGGHQVADRIRLLEDGEQIDYGVADPSMWRSDGGLSIAEQMAQSGVYWAKAANERGMGSQQMYARIKNGQMYVFSTCKDFIRCIPIAVTDEKKPEEYRKEGEDHVIDEARYACMSRPTVQKATAIKPSGLILPTMDELKPKHGTRWI